MTSIEIRVRAGIVRWLPPTDTKPGKWVFLRAERGKLIPSPMPKRLRKEYSESE